MFLFSSAVFTQLFTGSAIHSLYASMPSFSISYDFGGKNVGAKFMCYISGHTHADFITKNAFGQYNFISRFTDSITRQSRALDVPVSNDNNDITRDALTAVAFNTKDNAVVLTRIGTTATSDGYLRDTEGVDLTDS